jgi:bile acid-coenzyme A ligase
MAIISLSRILRYWAEQQGDTVAVSHNGDTVTWAELDARTNRLARAPSSTRVPIAWPEPTPSSV